MSDFSHDKASKSSKLELQATKANKPRITLLWIPTEMQFLLQPL
jgi:hypothetical protein